MIFIHFRVFLLIFYNFQWISIDFQKFVQDFHGLSMLFQAAAAACCCRLLLQAPAVGCCCRQLAAEQAAGCCCSLLSRLLSRLLQAAGCCCRLLLLLQAAGCSCSYFGDHTMGGGVRGTTLSPGHAFLHEACIRFSKIIRGTPPPEKKKKKKGGGAPAVFFFFFCGGGGPPRDSC